ncbi:Protein PER1 homolog [Sparassis crispa]|uniref:Post-GPI attachment to proteins factor 3 n=1 Tax=Sparassis crispa TaxID=139825 RepID=A0A401GKX1_9APHY|nr:Protein PER1 homolog [Sparassis crispa]GBE82800.1 Protein PER1 homolog [Sparassis crispa]
MHQITDNAVENGNPVQQYHGKWPFWRFAGMQEPASVAFSVLNLLAHARGARHVQESIHDGHPMKQYYLWGAFINMNAWFWSSVFHTRDLPLTEKLDYFSAALAIMIALYYTVIRLFHLYPPERNGPPSTFLSPRTFASNAWTCICIVAYLAHVSYLALLPRFDYAYNIAFNLAIGMLHNLLWVFYSLPSSISFIRRFPFGPESYRPKYASKAAIFVACTMLATALEVFDFPPWERIIDAHSLWHLSTVPITVFWYEFLVQDAQDDGWRVQKF